ncbi:hypothetical protein VQ03_02305 [Methylobacterium tarhaniae]|uniref:Uncharacterized protein n=1 Tax=Methylobacterium tarhaniae TaxID=1187852 RepID=A0A0J6VZ61_9HYPH|nr:hypothetical protein [Methylobacterium tarhaniae]KMO44611.1 hypothetical protein VQ03_02305 [Methylobacterium tarhaniae]
MDKNEEAGRVIGRTLADRLHLIEKTVGSSSEFSPEEECLELVRAFSRIADRRIRHRILTLVQASADREINFDKHQ